MEEEEEEDEEEEEGEKDKERTVKVRERLSEVREVTTATDASHDYAGIR